MKQSDKDENLEDEGISVYALRAKIYSHLKYLTAKWKIISIFLIIGVVLGVWVAINRKPKYLAQITFTVEDSQSGSGTISGLASQLGLSVGGEKQSIFSGFNIIAFFQSRLMVQKTLLTEAPFENGNELLVNRYIEFNHFHDQWKKNPKLANLTFVAGQPLTRLQDSVLNTFCTSIVASQLDVDRIDRRLSILTLTYSCTDELFSKNFSEALAKNVIQFYTNNRIEKTVKNINVLQHQTDSVRNRLNNSLTSVASSLDAVPNANPLKSVLAVSSQNKTVEAEIDRSALIQLAENLEGAKISLNQETPLIDFIDVPILPLDVVKLSKIKSGLIGGFLGLLTGVFILTVVRKTY